MEDERTNSLIGAVGAASCELRASGSLMMLALRTVKPYDGEARRVVETRPQCGLAATDYEVPPSHLPQMTHSRNILLAANSGLALALALALSSWVRS